MFDPPATALAVRLSPEFVLSRTPATAAAEPPVTVPETVGLPTAPVLLIPCAVAALPPVTFPVTSTFGAFVPKSIPRAADDEPPVTLPVTAKRFVEFDTTTHEVVHAKIEAAMVLADAASVSVNPPPAAPVPSAAVLSRAQAGTSTLIAIAVLAFAQKISPAAWLPHVSTLPPPAATSFHSLAESMLTVLFCAYQIVTTRSSFPRSC